MARYQAKDSQFDTIAREILASGSDEKSKLRKAGLAIAKEAILFGVGLVPVVGGPIASLAGATADAAEIMRTQLSRDKKEAAQKAVVDALAAQKKAATDKLKAIKSELEAKKVNVS